MTFGDSYIGHEVHTKHGMGYAVCLECNFEESVRYYDCKYKGVYADPSYRVMTDESEVEE